MTRVETLAYTVPSKRKETISLLVSMGISVTAALALMKLITMALVAMGVKSLGFVAYMAYLTVAFIIGYYSYEFIGEYVHQTIMGWNMYFKEGILTLVSEDGEVKEIDLNKFIPQSLKDKKTQQTETTKS